MTRYSSSEKNDRFHGRVLHAVPQPCAWGGCLETGEFKAPKTRPATPDIAEPQQPPVWLCLDHVREYNHAWDYFKGLKPEEIDAFMAANSRWQRPTFKVGDMVGRLDVNINDPLDLRRQAGDGFSLPAQGGGGRPLTPKDRKAMRVLGIEIPAKGDHIEAKVVKTHYRNLVKRLHPDRNPNDPKAAKMLRETIEAYNHLTHALKNQSGDTR